MAFSKIQFDTIEEFHRVMKKAKLNFVVFTDDDMRLTNAFPLIGDEVGYYIDVRELNPRCFELLIKNSVLDLRVNPDAGENKAIPHVRSFIGGQGFFDTYYDNGTCDLNEFVKRSREWAANAWGE